MKSISLALLALALPIASNAERLIFPPSPIQTSMVKQESLFQKVSEELSLNLKAEDFQLRETKESLLGKHLTYQQVKGGINIHESEVVISINLKNEVIKVYNNGVKVKEERASAGIPFISETQALESAWKHLKVSGELLDAPVVNLVYSKNMELIYLIDLSLSSPAGHYEITVDAKNGQVLRADDAAIPRMKRASAPIVLNERPVHSSLASALKSLEVKKVKKLITMDAVNYVNGSASIFDPNPVVTLVRSDLQDSSPSDTFLQAYRTAELKDISYTNGVYHLSGPKVTILDFEAPRVPPSTSADGSWVFERKDPRFNEAMTYFHLDRSVRYLEELGFTGSRSIFSRSLEVDANGLSGQDNSHYIPSSRRLAFGNGCVDDNEDADVILHELGHAIQHHINPKWGGGDSGAMGEGFGDYWAASYSLTAENGSQGNINWVFKWDGHNDCWPGRKLNAFTPVYNPTQTYYAHALVDGGISDELWSTPIFQSFLELMAEGTPRADTDKIILEAHFGLGSGVKMPEMAQSIVNAAKVLFPEKNYHQIYLKNFQKMKILQ